MHGRSARLIWIVSVLAALASPALAASVLFDATKHEMGGNADWVIDADSWNQNMPAYPCTGSTNESNPGRFPTPPQSGITQATSETYWTGGISSWAVELAKAGHTVESLPAGAPITFGDGGNPQDLSHYQLFILVEPQNPFSAAEKSAILAFVAAGGGLFMVADHETSDRDCDDWDAPHVFNDLTGATSASATGLFGIWFRVNGLEDQGSEDWFDDAIDDNVETSPTDPIINGPFGSGAGGLGLFGSTSMDLNPADNPTVTPHVWRKNQVAHGNLRVTFATASYGSGRVAALGDSSPADDDTGDPSDSLHPGWDKASGGVKNREIHLNACHWLLNPVPDTTAPAITIAPSVTASDCSAVVAWTTDEAATSVVDYGETALYGSSASVPGHVQAHSVRLTPLDPGTAYHYRVSSTDSVGNGPTQSGDLTFTTAPAADPVITVAPTATTITGSTAVISWTTDEASSSIVIYGPTAVYGLNAQGGNDVTAHQVTLSSLNPESLYHYRVLSSDACGAGPTVSPDATFTTGLASIDLSGWTLKQYTSSQTYVIPQGTTIPSGGYLVVGRNATRAEFAAAFPSLPAGAVYLDSNATGSCSAAGCFPQINGGESFELYDASSTKRDGATIAMSTNQAYQRKNPGDPPGTAGSWTVVSESLANPGQGAGAGSASGVRINEMSDAPDFTKEFVELYYDAAPPGPDLAAPAAVVDLVAWPQTSISIVLVWTATGDDGTVGNATSYDIRWSARPILTDADFAAATPIPFVFPPKPPGTVESYGVSLFVADTAYFFALKVADEAGHVSSLSNGASAVTGPPGDGASVDHLVISQIRIAGTVDDVVELYNPTFSPISLANTSIQYLAASGNFGFKVNLTGANSVPSHGWYLVAANGYPGSPARDDSLATNNLSSTAGHVLLVSKTTNVSGCSDAAIIDKVGYGATASCPEGGSGHAATTPGSGTSVTRKPGQTSGSGQDTDVNDADFLPPGTPVFRNRFSTPATPPAGLGSVRNTLFLTKGAGGTELSWANAQSATAYRVYRGTTPGFMAGNPAPWGTPSGNATTDGETPSAVFYYVVRATDGVDESAE